MCCLWANGVRLDKSQSALPTGGGPGFGLLGGHAGPGGQSLQADLLDKVGRIEALLEKVAATAPTVVEDYRARLAERLAELLEGTTITEERFLGEVAIYAENAASMKN